MTRIAIIAAIALNVSVASGFAQFNPDLARTLVPTVPSQDVAADLGGDRDIKVRCIMPPALQTSCNL